MADPIRIFTDGACQPNPGQMGIGVVIEWQNQKAQVISYHGGYGTNNIAEYLALREAIKQIQENTILIAEINSDSNLIVQQVNGKWQCKDMNLKPYCNYITSKLKELKSNGFDITLQYIPRELNVADTPAKNGCKLNGT